MLRFCQYHHTIISFKIQYLERSLLLLVTSASDLSLRTIKCCSVVSGITLRLLVINTSSSSPANNTRRRLLLSAMSVTNLLATVRHSCVLHLAVEPLIARDEARQQKLEQCGYPMGKNLEDMFIRFDRVHERDRRTDRRTYGHRTRRQRPRLRIASRSKNLTNLESSYVDSVQLSSRMRRLDQNASARQSSHCYPVYVHPCFVVLFTLSFCVLCISQTSKSSLSDVFIAFRSHSRFQIHFNKSQHVSLPRAADFRRAISIKSAYCQAKGPPATARKTRRQVRCMFKRKKTRKLLLSQTVFEILA